MTGDREEGPALAEGRHPSFHRPSVIEALCEVHFRRANDQLWHPSLSSDVYRAVARDYQNMEPAFEVGLQLEVGPDGVGQRVFPSLHSYYRDPYLGAVIEQSGVKVGGDVAKLRHYGWDGFVPERRWIRLAQTLEDLMSWRNDGFQLGVSSEAAFMAVCEEHGVGEDRVLRVPQVVFDGVTYDMEDRILAGAKLLQALIANQRQPASVSLPNGGPMAAKCDVYLLAEMPGDRIKVFGKKPEVGGLDVVVVQREGCPIFPDYADRIGRFMPYVQWRETALKLAPEDVPAEFTASSFELPPEEM